MPIAAWLRRHGDVVLAGALAVGYAFELSRYPRTVAVYAIPLAVLGCLALVLRRRVPLVSFLLVLALTQAVLHWAPGFQHDSISSIALIMISLYSLGRHARGLEAWLAIPAVLLEIALSVIDDGDESAVGIFFFLVFLGLPWAAGLAVRLRVERVRELNAANAELAEQARRAVADERARIARELHDVVSHAIAVSVLQARGSRKLVGRDDEAVRRALAAIEQTNTSALTDMRRLLSLLRRAEDGSDPVTDEPQPTLEQLDSLIDQVRASGLPVALRTVGEPLPMPPGLDLSAYRIVQEALTNVLKHAGPDATAEVVLRYGAEELEVEVTDVGIRSLERGATGHGLIGIGERAAVTGGSVEVGPTVDGFRVCARLPYLPVGVASER